MQAETQQTTFIVPGGLPREILEIETSYSLASRFFRHQSGFSAGVLFFAQYKIDIALNIASNNHIWFVEFVGMAFAEQM